MSVPLLQSLPREQSRAPRTRAERGLVRQILSVALGQGIPQLLSVVAAFVLAGRVGAESFGAWTVSLSLVALLSAVDGGVVAAVTWRVSVEVGAGRRGTLPALLAAGVAASLCVGLLATVAFAVAGPDLVRLLELGGSDPGQALSCLHLVGPLVGMSLLNGLTTGYLRAVGADLAVVVAAAAGVLAFAATATVLWGSQAPLAAGMTALLAQALASWLVTGCAAWRRGARLGARRVPRGERRQLSRYCLHGQVAALTALAALQLDALVVAAIATPAQLGAYGVAATAAMALRTAPFFVLTPVRTRLGLVAGARGDAAAVTHAQRVGRAWSRGLALYVLTLAPVGALLVARLTDTDTFALLTYALLVAGYVANLSVGVRVALLAAVGRTSAIATSGLLTVGVNLAVTVPLALALGPVGVVLGTVAGQLLSPLPILRASALPGPGPHQQGARR